MIRNYSNCKEPMLEFFVSKLVNSIPKCLVPKNGIPDLNLTNSIFHSYGIMFRKYFPTGTKEEEEFFDFCRAQKTWAFSCLRLKERGDTYLSFKERLESKEKNDIYKFSLEHVVFHEIGHHFYYQRGIDVSSILDVEHETLADIYANACMINFFQKNKPYNGIILPLSKRSIEILNKETSKRIKNEDLLKIAELIWRKYGVI